MLEPLGDKVKKFAEQSRDRLLEEIRIKKGKDTVDAVWQGFDSDGKALVKYGDETKKAKGLGNASKIKGQKVLVDKVNTAEYERVNVKKEAPKVKAAGPIETQIPTREDLLLPFHMPIGEDEKVWVLAYLTHRRITTEGSVASAAVPGIYTTGSWSDSATIDPDADASTYGKRISLYGAAAIAVSQFGTASASATGPVSASASSTSVVQAQDLDVDYGYSIGHNTGNLTAQASSYPSGQGPVQVNGGLAEAAAGCGNYTLPNGYLYIEWTNMGQGVEPMKINLNNHVTHDITFQKLRHLFCKRNSNNQVIAYVSLDVVTANLNDTTLNTYGGGSLSYFVKELQIGPPEEGVMHLEINLSSRSVIQSKYTTVRAWPNSYTFQIRSGAENPYTGVNAYVSISVNNYNQYIEKNLKHITECYSGDWMYPFRGTAFDSTAWSNLTREEIFGFLSCMYLEETETYWYGFHSICPKVAEYNLGSTYGYLGESSFWTPPETSGWYGNNPNYGNYQDIEGLSPTIRLSQDSFHLQYANFYNLNAGWNDSSVYGYRRMSPVLPVTTEVRWGSASSTSLGDHGDDIEWDFFMARTYRP